MPDGHLDDFGRPKGSQGAPERQKHPKNQKNRQILGTQNQHKSGQDRPKTPKSRPQVGKHSTRRTRQETYAKQSRMSFICPSFLHLQNLVSYWFFIYDPQNRLFEDKTDKCIQFGSTLAPFLVDFRRLWAGLGRLGGTLGRLDSTF